MDFQNDQPIYIQIGTFIKEQIINGTIRPGEKLPSVREYAVFFEVSPLTIHGPSSIWSRRESLRPEKASAALSEPRYRKDFRKTW